MRYFIQLSYNGAQFCGWQIQPNAPSVQARLNEALSKILREEIYVVGAGRTDTGVHAKQMFAHFESDAEIDLNHLTHRLNRFLKDDVAVQQIFPVKEDAHTRFSATSRSYEYWVTQVKNPFLANWSWQIDNPLKVDAMNACAQTLLGEHDFSSFSKSGTQTETNLCHVNKAYWEERDNLLIFHISANRFLRNMVRAIVGTLVEVGQNKLDQAGFIQLIEQKNRSMAGVSAPAKGLYLTQVEYPKSIYVNGWN